MNLQRIGLGRGVIDDETGISITKEYNGGVTLQHAFMLRVPNCSAETYWGKGCFKFVAGHMPAVRQIEFNGRIVAKGFTAGYWLGRSALMTEFEKFTAGDPTKFEYALELVTEGLKLYARGRSVPDDGNDPPVAITICD